MVCKNTLENCRLFTNYSLLKVRFKLGCVKFVLRLFEARKDGLGWICDISFTVILRYSFALLTCLFSDIQWSNCFESIRAKLKFSFFFSHFTVLNKPQKLTDHERENLVFGRNCVPKGMIVSPTRVFHSKALWLGTIQIFQTQVRLWGCECATQSRSKQVFLSERVKQARLSGNDEKSLYSSSRGYIFAVLVNWVVVFFARHLPPRKCKLCKVDDYRNTTTVKFCTDVFLVHKWPSIILKTLRVFWSKLRNWPESVQ